jgi:cell shape-determining protein MreC
MLGRMGKNKGDTSVLIDVFLDHSTHDRFRAFAVKNGLNESDALVRVLERGMANYWLMDFKRLKQSYLPMEKLFKEYKKDNGLLKALEQQNEQLKKILEMTNQKTFVQKSDRKVDR